LRPLGLQVDVVLQQALERRPRLVDLRGVGFVRAREPVHALPRAVQVVEAVVLLVDDDDVVDLAEVGAITWPGLARRSGRRGEREREGCQRDERKARLPPTE
jgi:hypothetical protein